MERRRKDEKIDVFGELGGLIKLGLKVLIGIPFFPVLLVLLVLRGAANIVFGGVADRAARRY